MRYTWDESKRRSNLSKHGFRFEDTEVIFAGPVLTLEDARKYYGERRWFTLGLLGNRVVVVVHTETGNEVRVISMRKANKHEQALFYSNLR